MNHKWSVTYFSAISLFIECHRNVLHIDHEESFYGLELAKQQNINNDQHSNFRLTELQSTKQTLNPDLFEYTIDYCPNLRTVTIKSPGSLSIIAMFDPINIVMIHISLAVCLNRPYRYTTLQINAAETFNQTSLGKRIR